MNISPVQSYKKSQNFGSFQHIEINPNVASLGSKTANAVFESLTEIDKLNAKNIKLFFNADKDSSLIMGGVNEGQSGKLEVDLQKVGKVLKKSLFGKTKESEEILSSGSASGHADTTDGILDLIHKAFKKMNVDPKEQELDRIEAKEAIDEAIKFANKLNNRNA